MEINQRPAIAYLTFYYRTFKRIMENRRNRSRKFQPVWDICPVAENSQVIAYGIAYNDFKDPKIFDEYCNGNHNNCPKKSGGDIADIN